MPCRPNAWRWCFRFLHLDVSDHGQAGRYGCTGWILDHPEEPGGTLYDTVPDPGSRQRAASCRRGYKGTYRGWNPNVWNVLLWNQKQSVDCAEE